MKKKIQFLVSIIVLFFGLQVVAQFDIPEKPKGIKQTSVFDYIGLLSRGEKTTLENKLIKYADTTSTQIVVAIIPSTNGEEIGYLATNWAHKWGIGQEKEDNGVFLLLAQDDRKITIRTGYGTEHLLTDYICRQIIEYNIIPSFKQGNYFAGLNSGVNSIIKVLAGEYKSSRKESEFDPTFIIIIIFFIIFILLASRGGRNNKGNRRNYRRTDSRDIFETIILSNSGRGGFGGRSGGFGSGGFGGGFGGSSGGFGGGFGGGGFGGGGATGGW